VDKKKKRAEDIHDPSELVRHMLHEAWTICWCLGLGTAMTSEMDTWCTNDCKFLCVRCSYSTGTPFEDDGCCAYSLTLRSFWSQFRLPPHIEGNPVCAVCGKKFRHVHLNLHRAQMRNKDSESEFVREIEEPTQQEMV